jgi:hypothetical protein
MLLPDPRHFDDRKSFRIFDRAEEALFRKLTFSTGSLDGPCVETGWCTPSEHLGIR